MTASNKPNYPKRAETRFQLLCDDVDLTRHKSTDDRTGWDYLLEFDRRRILGLAHDQQPGSSAARVQVKSKVGGHPRTSFKLTNALRFTREPDICFVVLFWFSRDGKVERIYARHFYSALMAASLKRAREADRDGNEALNRIAVPIAFSDEDDHSYDLVQWMRGICDQQPEGYAVDKKTLANSLGYEGMQFSGKFTVPYDQLQTLIDHSVGLVPAAPVDHVTIYNRRFDIAAKIPFFDNKPDFTRISVNPEPATMTITGENGYVAHLIGETRSFALSGLPINTARLVFTAPYFRAILSGNGDAEATYGLDPNSALPLRTLKELCSFFLAARSTMELTLTVGGRPPLDATAATVTNTSDRWFDWLDGVVSCLLKVCGIADNPIVVIKDLIDAEDAIFSLAKCVSEGDATLTFHAKGMTVAMPTAKNLIGFGKAQVGPNTYWAVYRRPCLRQEAKGDHHTFLFGDPVLLANGATSGIMPIDALNDRMIKLSKRVGNGTVVFNEGDINSLSSGVLNLGFL